MRKFFLMLTVFSVFILASPVLAQEPDYDRINNIAENLNCPTCAGINLADCRTLTCEQWRNKIADLVEEGYSDQEVLDYFSAQYGTQVLQEPPRSGFTLALWILPVIAVLVGGGWLVYTIRGWANTRGSLAAQGSTTSMAAQADTGQQMAATTADSSTADVASLPADEADLADDYLSQVEKDLGIEDR